MKKTVGLCLKNWYWFVIALALTLTCAFFYIKSTPPVYSRSASIMVKQTGTDGMDKTMKELGIDQPSTNLVNEILLINSSVVAEEVTKRLNLDFSYYQDGIFYDPIVYGTSLPVTVNFLDINDIDHISFRINCNADSSFTFRDWVKNGEPFDGTVTAQAGDTLSTPVGTMVVRAGSAIGKRGISQLDVVRSDFNSAAQKVRRSISAKLRDKSASIIDINCKDISRSRADDILNTLITVYNEQWMKNRNQQIVSTNDFIRERLAVIEEELGSVDDDISAYKSENLMIDVNQAGAMAVSEASESAKMDAELAQKIGQLRTTYEYIASLGDDSRQIPIYSTIENGAILQRIAEYNQLILERNNHQSFSSAQNPLVVDLNQQLASQRSMIVAALAAEIASLQSQQNALRATRREAESKIARNPQQANYLLSVERQQKVKESLYLFLLQKREENELSQAFTAYNTQLLEPAHGSWDPVEPVAKSIYLLAILAGLAIPILVMFLKEVLTTTVQGRDDVKSMQVPFAGVIPQKGGKKKLLKKQKDEHGEILVQEGKRDVMNEAFRVVRSNIEFVLGFDEVHKVMMLTSLDPGSGKTFITANLASALALKGKKVLAVDLDLRKASLSEYAGKPGHGISGYLGGKYDSYRDLIVKAGNFDILPCGALPPNPAELLYTERFQKLVDEVRKEYDYVILDCPPAEVVADASIINRYADLTIFVARCGLLEKSMLPEIDSWYQNKQYNNMVLLLNGADADGGRYGYHKYGYHKYGYSYYGSKS